MLTTLEFFKSYYFKKENYLLIANLIGKKISCGSLPNKIIQQQIQDYCSHFDIKICYLSGSPTYFTSTTILNSVTLGEHLPSVRS